MLTITQEINKHIKMGENFVIRQGGLEIQIPYIAPVSKEKDFEYIQYKNDDKPFLMYGKYKDATILLNFRVGWKDFLRVGDVIWFEIADTTNGHMKNANLKGVALYLNIQRGTGRSLKRMEILVDQVVAPTHYPIWEVM